jgi:hypothetical protein
VCLHFPDVLRRVVSQRAEVIRTAMITSRILQIGEVFHSHDVQGN